MINTYNANGQKLRTKYYTAITSVIVPVGTIHGSYSANDATLRLDDYFGSILYENGTAEDAAHHPLTKVMTPEGYVDYATAGKPYCYYRQDHLGSIREVDSYSGNNRTVVQKTQYYPSGTSFQENFGAGEQPYKFTGKELITMHGLNWQDFGARWLDNVRMQFTSVDPLAEKYYSISPYAYCLNNPVNLIDPDGKKITNSNGYVLSNRTLMEQLAKFDIMVSRLSGLDRNSYLFNISGGDRYRKNGKIYSATNNTPVGKSAKFSPHLRESGAFAVDLAFSKNISYDIIQAAAKSVGMRLDPDGAYTDGHFHLDIKNYKGNFVYEGINYIPTNDDFIGNNNSFIGGDKEHTIELDDVEVTAKNPNPEKTLDERIDDMLWSTVRPNENGNTGRYNQDGRSTDKLYNDDFLKWYYNLDK